MPGKRKKLDKILVVDTEATCWEGSPPEGETSEIIEIGVCLLDVKTLERSDKTSILVAPHRSKVSQFCTALTTLTQEQVDEGVTLREACERLRDEFDSVNRTWASYGDYDRVQFERDCKILHNTGMDEVKYPFGRTHINVKNLASISLALPKEVGMKAMLGFLKIHHEGTHHRGDSDAWNVAGILSEILARACTNSCFGKLF